MFRSHGKPSSLGSTLDAPHASRNLQGTPPPLRPWGRGLGVPRGLCMKAAEASESRRGLGGKAINQSAKAAEARRGRPIPARMTAGSSRPEPDGGGPAASSSGALPGPPAEGGGGDGSCDGGGSGGGGSGGALAGPGLKLDGIELFAQKFGRKRSFTPQDANASGALPGPPAEGGCGDGSCEDGGSGGGGGGGALAGPGPEGGAAPSPEQGRNNLKRKRTAHA